MTFPRRKVVGELIGTAFLVAAVVGSGIMGQRLAGGNTGIALLANSIATGAALVALILSFGPISGAHLNPAVTLCLACRGSLAFREVPRYIAFQTTGAFIGVAMANVMFGLPPFFSSTHVRGGGDALLSEFLATFGLVTVVFACSRYQPGSVPYAVAAYIAAAYWFTSSTSFANPAVTAARAATNTFAGIRPLDVPGFITAQLLGALSATGLFQWMDIEVNESTVYTQSMKANTESKKRVLFLCTGNSARSQMAEALMSHLAGDRYEVFSAGTHPKGLHPMTIEVMREIGLDLSRQTSKDVNTFVGQEFDYVITVCDRARQNCPIFPGSEAIHWGFDDPAESEISQQRQLFSRVRDEILQRIRLFVASNRS